MEHNLHNTPIHWGYNVTPAPTTTTQNHWAPPPQNRSVKRTLSESDCDELYSEESSKEQISPGDASSCQLMSRKKRRGVIEKKRRDRINSSLSELKRLVPSAYEKQGSAKLEKAEILQLTVEHLKNIHSKGLDTIAYDPQRFAMDYHIIGFRECAAEVARYLVTIEGMDIQDPLRLRLMSHLQYFVQQRELSTKGCSSPSGWATPGTPSSYQTPCASSPYQAYSNAPMHTGAPISYVPNLPAPIQPYPTLNSPPGPSSLLQSHHQHHQQAASVHIARPNSGTLTETNDNTIPLMAHPPTPQSQATHQIHTRSQGIAQAQAQQQQQQQQTQQPQTGHHHHHQQQQQQQQQQQHYQQEATLQDQQSEATYIELTNSQAHTDHRNPESPNTNTLEYANPSEYPVTVAQVYSTNSGLNYVSTNGSKPYRPWGAEMAY